MVPIPSFNPITQVAPVTYRDTDTFLTQLRKLRQALEQLSEHTELNFIEHVKWVNDVIKTLEQNQEKDFASLEKRLTDLITAGGFAWNPVNGSRTNNLTQVFGMLYDNVRVYAKFAWELDGENKTAAEWDAVGYTAREFDTAYGYPQIHNTLN